MLAPWDFFCRVVIGITRFNGIFRRSWARTLSYAGLLKREIFPECLTLIMSGKWRVHYNPPPTRRDNIKIAGVTAIDIGFPFLICNLTSTPRFFFHIDATAIAIFDGFLKCYTKASASAVFADQTSCAQQSFCLRIQFFLTHLSNGEGSGVNPAVTSGVKCHAAFRPSLILFRSSGGDLSSYLCQTNALICRRPFLRVKRIIKVPSCGGV